MSQIRLSLRNLSVTDKLAKADVACLEKRSQFSLLITQTSLL